METDTVIEERPETSEEIEVTEPNFWNVIMFNDDRTTMDFVMALLVQIFNKSPSTAYELMLAIHNKGQAVVGTYTHEIAEQKRNISVDHARSNNFPLKVEIEEDL